LILRFDAEGVWLVGRYYIAGRMASRVFPGDVRVRRLVKKGRGRM
jgi:hypothetical protein